MKTSNLEEGVFSGIKIVHYLPTEQIEEVEMPDFLKRAIDINDICYANDNIELTNVSFNTDKTKITVNAQEVQKGNYGKVEIKEGPLKNITIYIGKNIWDISQNGDGSVIAELFENGTLTISGNGEMKDWLGIEDSDWHIKMSQIVKIVIGNEIKNIGYFAFNGCFNLEEVQMSDGIERIGVRAFGNCEKLKSFMIPKQLSVVESGFLEDCSNLLEIKVDPENKEYYAIDGVLFGKKQNSNTITQEILKYPEAKEEKQYCIPDNIEVIGNSAFYGCENLEEIVIPDSLNTIGDYAFKGAKNLKQINLTNRIQIIGSWAFQRTAFTSFYIPESVTEIRNTIFEGCEKLEEIIVNENNPNYSSQDGVFFNKDKTVLIKYPENRSDRVYAIPESVEEIECNAFYYTEYLKIIGIPSQVTKIYSTSIWSGYEIYAKSGSTAETYAKDNKYPYEILDKAPTIQVSYDTIQERREVRVTIKADTKIQKVDGWSIVDGNEIIYKDYDKNAKENIVIKDLVGNKTSVEISLLIKGDIDDNGKIDSTDLLKMMRHIVANSNQEIGEKNPNWLLNERQFEYGDINYDQEINTTDIVKLMRNIVASKNQEIAQKHPDGLL